MQHLYNVYYCVLAVALVFNHGSSRLKIQDDRFCHWFRKRRRKMGVVFSICIKVIYQDHHNKQFCLKVEPS